MSLIPDFELGLWNAWILVIPMSIISRARAAGAKLEDTKNDIFEFAWWMKK